MSNNSIVGQWAMKEQWFLEKFPMLHSPDYPFSLEFKANGALSVPNDPNFTGAWQQNGDVVMFTLGLMNGFPKVNGSYIGQLKNGSLSGHALGLCDLVVMDVPVNGNWSGTKAQSSVQPSGRPLNIKKKE